MNHTLKYTTCLLHRRQYFLGWSLLELLCVLVIISIIASFAYPSYHTFLIQTKRAEGKAALLSNMQLLEQHYASTGTYANSPLTPEQGWMGLRAFSKNIKEDSHYQISIHHCDAKDVSLNTTPTYNECAQLRATPFFEDHQCGVLTLNTLDVQGATHQKPGSSLCW